LKIKTFITNVNQSFETEADGFTFTFQPNDNSEVETIEQATDNASDQSDEDTRSLIYVPSSKPTPSPPSSPWARSTTPPSPPPQSEEPTEEPTGSKRNKNTPFPSPEPKKVKRKVTSAIRQALELSTAGEAENGQSAKRGLLNYFSKGTEEDRKAYFSREDERSNEARLQAGVNAKDLKARKRVRERDMAKERQRKHRQLVKNQEIRSGERSPGGTKRKVSNLRKKR
jgi:hypothetical protein